MRFLRVRFTIGRLMLAVLVAGLIFWELVLPWIKPSTAEQEALSSYKQAELTREVAEYAIKEYKDGVFKQINSGGVVFDAVVPAEVALARAAAQEARRQAEAARQAIRNEAIRSLQSDAARARADEQAKRAVYLRERARHWGIYAWW